jgi:hypothetical protein
VFIFWGFSPVRKVNVLVTTKKKNSLTKRLEAAIIGGATLVGTRVYEPFAVTARQMQYETRPRGDDPDIGTAWLVLSHGAFLGASVGASALAVTLILFVFETSADRRRDCMLQALAIGWNVVSFLISAWTAFAITRTWQTALLYSQQIFGHFEFATLMFVAVALAVALAAVNIWSCVIAVNYVRRNRTHSSARTQRR